MVVCSLFAPFLPRLDFFEATESALRLLPTAGEDFFWEGLGLELGFAAAWRAEDLVPAMLKVKLGVHVVQKIYLVDTGAEADNKSHQSVLCRGGEKPMAPKDFIPA